jgi:ADP-dependent NAD(P)H-hydrate dehydratase
MSPDVLTEEYLATHPLPDHSDGGSKDHRGRVLIVAGSRQVPGAAILAGLAALRAGAGVLQIATCASVAAHIAVAMPEAMVLACEETSAGGISPAEADNITSLAKQADALLVGPGMMDDLAVQALTASLLPRLDLPIILDAAAITTLSDHDLVKMRRGATALTPHAGEMATFLRIERSEVERDMLSAARRAAELSSAVIAMKGAKTFIADVGGQVWVSAHGCSSLATSGSGDTLAGIIAGLLARGVQPGLAILWSVYLHGEAGLRLARKHGHVGALAREIPDEIPRIMQDFMDGGPGISS